MSNDRAHCERCGVVAPFTALFWVPHEPRDPDSTTWAVCGMCEQRLACVCNGEGCRSCGYRTERWSRIAERRNEKQRRKDEHRAERGRRDEGEPGPDPLSSEIEEEWTSRYLDYAVIDGPPHRTAQRLSLGASVAPLLDAARLP